MSDPVERLRWHAALDGEGAETTVSEATASRDASQMEASTADFIMALDDYNRSLNGPSPSAGGGELRSDDVVSRGAAYAVAEVARMLRYAGADNCAWRIDVAWAAVLAGDIEDIPQHVAWEDSARG